MIGLQSSIKKNIKNEILLILKDSNTTVTQSDYTFGKPYSEKTAEIIDDEVKIMIDKQYNRAKSILTENRDKHEQLARLLLDKEVLFAEDLANIFGKRKQNSRKKKK